MMRFFDILRYLGPRWICFRLLYALRHRMGIVRRKSPCQPWKDCSKYQWQSYAPVRLPEVSRPKCAINDADRILSGELNYFFRHWLQVGLPPPWSTSPFADDECEISPTAHWSHLSDFGGTDIKTVWEPSRFAFAFTLSDAFQVTGNNRYAEAFWSVLEDWQEKNQPNQGPNWMCGQEVAIRIIAWVNAASAMNSAPATTASRMEMLAQMVGVSAERIEMNIGYALSQNNNHGISEAAGLFTAGIVLGNENWLKRGQRLLENQGQTLIYADGSFSQHSMNYHRVVLDMYFWAIQLGQLNSISFSSSMLEHYTKACEWMHAMVDPESGRAPVLGGNDGAWVLPLSGVDYLDYGTSLAAQNPELTATLAHSNKPRHFPDGGYVVFPFRHGKVVFRCPAVLRHRPHHCDMLHLDAWHRGVNILRDAGTFSYNCEQTWQDFFKSTAAHNTVMFDAHQQMPKLGRFLYGKWPNITVEAGCTDPAPFVSAGYRDWRGCSHHRRVEQINDMKMTVTDTLSGFNQQANLHWHLAPELDWHLEGNACISNRCIIRIECEEADETIELKESWESLYYLSKNEVPMLSVVVPHPCRIVTYVELI